MRHTFSVILGVVLIVAALGGAASAWLLACQAFATIRTERAREMWMRAQAEAAWRDLANGRRR